MRERFIAQRIALLVVLAVVLSGCAGGVRRDELVKLYPEDFTALGSDDAATRLGAVKRLGAQHDARLLGTFSGLFRDGSPDVRAAAMYGMLELPAGDDVADVLVDKLDEPDPKVRWQAARGLGYMRAKEALGPLGKAIRDADPGVRAVSAWAIGRIGDRGSLPELTEALRDADRQVRIEAVGALGELKCAESVAPLVALLKDPSPDIRASAAMALGEIGDTAALQPLKELLNDPDAWVKKNARMAIESISGVR
jgi:hypothetical protein